MPGDSMVARGRVQDGVVVLNDGVRLPEGQEVTVLAPGGAASRGGGEAAVQPNPGRGSETSSVGPLPSTTAPGHSLLDLPPLSLGRILRPFMGGDLLGEMLEDRL